MKDEGRIQETALERSPRGGRNIKAEGIALGRNTGPQGRLRAACFCYVREEHTYAAAFPFPPSIGGGQGWADERSPLREGYIPPVLIAQPRRAPGFLSPPSQRGEENGTRAGAALPIRDERGSPARATFDQRSRGRDFIPAYPSFRAPPPGRRDLEASSRRAESDAHAPEQVRLVLGQQILHDHLVGRGHAGILKDDA